MSESPKIGSHQSEIAKFKRDEQFYSAIGRFITEFSKIESLLKYIIEATIKLPNEYTDAIMQYDFAMLCTISENVVSRTIDDTRKAQLKKVIRKCRELNNHRVRIVHGSWNISPIGGVVLHTSRQKLEPTPYYKRNPRELAEQADIAGELWYELVDFWEPPQSK